MILPAQTIRQRAPVSPFHERSISHGMTYGLGPAGYDVRIAETFALGPEGFKLASTVEQFDIPADIIAFVHDKSTWARRGLSLFNTVIEPGWRGFLTLELINNGNDLIRFEAGMPIAQIIFMRLEEATALPYSGRYQDQAPGPQAARLMNRGGEI